MSKGDGTGPTGEGPGTGRRRRGSGGGMGRGQSQAGLVGFCICLSCGAREPHQIGSPCYDKKCPNCGGSMIRE